MYLARSSPTVLTWFMDASLSGLQRPHSGTPRPPGASTPSQPDTIVIGAAHLRLVGIDTPESDQTCADHGGLPYPCGAVAARALAGFIGPEPVTCKREGEDVYHRILATCFVRGEDIQRWMVAQGYALAFTRYSQAYASDEAQARVAGRGVWAGSVVPPWDYWRCVREGGAPATCSHTVEASSSPVAPVPLAERGTAPAGSGPPSPECRIKGNVNQAGERIYHLPSSPDYHRIVMRLDRGKRWFCDEAEARAAGWRPAAH